MAYKLTITVEKLDETSANKIANFVVSRLTEAGLNEDTIETKVTKRAATAQK